MTYIQQPVRHINKLLLDESHVLLRNNPRRIEDESTYIVMLVEEGRLALSQDGGIEISQNHDSTKWGYHKTVKVWNRRLSYKKSSKTHNNPNLLQINRLTHTHMLENIASLINRIIAI